MTSRAQSDERFDPGMDQYHFRLTSLIRRRFARSSLTKLTKLTSRPSDGGLRAHRASPVAEVPTA